MAGVCKVLCQKSMCGRWRGAWACAGWRVWDLGNGTIMLQKLFNPEWQITSKSFLLSSFLIGFSFSPTAEISRLELECEGSLPRKFSKRGLDRSQMEQPIKKNKFSYFARSRLRLRPQEIWILSLLPTYPAPEKSLPYSILSTIIGPAGRPVNSVNRRNNYYN